MSNYFLTYLKCSKCNAEYDSNVAQQLCICGAPLLVSYNLKGVASSLLKRDLLNRKPTLWRYRELLPVRDDNNITSLGEGMTPLVKLNNLGTQVGLTELYLKDEGVIPTGTFKARGAAVGISKAKELGIKEFAMPTNGNAGGAWAIYAAAAGIKAHIVMPKDAPKITRNECVISGADLRLVNGLISDAGKIVASAVSRYGWFDASTLKEPYRIEGKKTMGLEIAEQFNWEVPDVILYPTGGGVGIIGIYKALLELQEMGWIGEKLPKLVAVQADGCAPIVKAWEKKELASEFWPNAKTVAFGITVPKALGDFLVLDAIYKTNGCAVSVSDDETLAAQSLLARSEGNFICPEGAATLAAALKLRDQGWVGNDDKIVLLNTGTGIKYPDIAQFDAPLLAPEDQI